MKIHSTLPERQDFFGYYATLIPTLFKVGFLSQLFSAAIETYILFSIIRPKFGDIEAPGAAAFFTALLLVALLEGGLRTGAAFSVRAILHRKFSGLDLPMTVFIFLLSCSLLLCSIVLHVEGAKEAVEVNQGGPTIESTDAVNQAGSQEAAELLRSFSQDSATIAAAYLAKIRAAKIEAAAQEQRYIVGKGATAAGAAAIRAKGAAKVATLEAEKGEKLQEAQERKTGRIETIKNRQYNAADGIEQRNQTARQKAEARLNKYSSYLSIFSVLTVLFFLLTIALNEVYKKGSGLKEVAIPSQYQFEPALLSKFTTALNDKFQAHARRAIERIEESIPAPRAPLAPHPLFDYSGLQPERLTAQTRQRANNENSEPGGEQSTRKQEAGLNGKHNETGGKNGPRPGGDEDGGLFVAATLTPGGGGGGNIQGKEPDNSTKNTSSGSLAVALLGAKQVNANKTEKVYIERPAFTIEHNGKHYTLRDVNSFITTYTRRADVARKQGNPEALKTRAEALEYWKQRREELLQKMATAE